MWRIRKVCGIVNKNKILKIKRKDAIELVKVSGI
jgi:hypothetical protein